ncbi:MAG TPA: Maf family protein [Mariprofundaceae bacterium]|nr:Maf family protein [Mariprofundaceae bacterium]
MGAGLTPSPLILASTSPFRRQLLARLRLPFTVEAPDFTEAAAGTMPPHALVRHNTLGKAHAVAARHPDACVIASDQIAVCGDAVLGKPGSADQACRQLSMLSGQTVEFLTGLAVLAPDSHHYETVPYRVVFRTLTMDEIRTYVALDQPLACAGSFKAESLGISLFERMEGEDPTALIGLPLIRLSAYLRPLQRA